eukprot:gene11793-2169_t
MRGWIMDNVGPRIMMDCRFTSFLSKKIFMYCGRSSFRLHDVTSHVLPRLAFFVACITRQTVMKQIQLPILSLEQGIQIFPNMTSRGIHLLQPCTSTPLNSDDDSDIEGFPMDELSYMLRDSTMETSGDEDSYTDEYVC